MRFLSHLLYVGSGHNELLDNFLILAEFVRQFAKLVLELVQLHVLNVQVVLGVLLDVSDLRHIIVIFCVVIIVQITVIFVGSLDIRDIARISFLLESCSDHCYHQFDKRKYVRTSGEVLW